MSDKLYIMPSGKFPMQNGKPVAITQSEFVECCCSECIWVCNENYSYHSGCIDLLARFPNIPCGEGTVPYPNGVICLGPFDVDVYIRHETDVQCYYDDKFVAGVVDFKTCEPPPSKWGEWYGPLDGVELVTPLQNPLVAGDIYTFTIVSTRASIVGIGISGGIGSYSRVRWTPV